MLTMLYLPMERGQADAMRLERLRDHDQHPRRPSPALFITGLLYFGWLQVALSSDIPFAVEFGVVFCTSYGFLLLCREGAWYAKALGVDDERGHPVPVTRTMYVPEETEWFLISVAPMAPTPEPFHVLITFSDVPSPLIRFMTMSARLSLIRAVTTPLHFAVLPSVFKLALRE